MNVTTAIELLNAAVARSSQVRVAQRMGVGNATISRWLAGDAVPTGKAAEKLMQWAGSVDAAAAPDSISVYDEVVAAVIATGENRARLGVVQGYAEFVLSQLEDLVKRQREVVNGIKPFAEAEGQALAANVPREKLPELLASIRRYQAQQEPAAAPAARRRGKR